MDTWLGALRSSGIPADGSSLGELGSSFGLESATVRVPGLAIPAATDRFYTELWADRNERKRKRGSWARCWPCARAKREQLGFGSGQRRYDGAPLQGGASARVSTPPSIPEPQVSRVKSDPANLALAGLVVDRIQGLFEAQQLEFEQGDDLSLELTPPQLARLQQQHSLMRSALTFLQSLDGGGGAETRDGVRGGNGVEGFPPLLVEATSHPDRATNMTGGPSAGEYEITSILANNHRRKTAERKSLGAESRAEPHENLSASPEQDWGESQGTVAGNAPRFSDSSKVPGADPRGNVAPSAQSFETGASIESHRWCGSDSSLETVQKEGDWNGFLIEQPVVHGCKMRCERAPGNLLGCFLLNARQEKATQGEHARGTGPEVDDAGSPIFVDLSAHAHALRTELRKVEMVVLDDCKSSGLREVKLIKDALCTARKD
ncbi:hypothetical protein KFL_000670370 [Klebsormidium nitens]|uniref:Uncharacterized protein n=1 Tax=Klebsormidium nitens TaxID=105231 RepID=A0A1Y1HQS6_KLENI|nr:hypothetical protein KFL_000670370 [Klebsormidium nitens]|eukprot:GAQ80980.1 hypothetical protein KFL_000670370 [Klebsormidium nitens]